METEVTPWVQHGSILERERHYADGEVYVEAIVAPASRSEVVEVCVTDGRREHVRIATFCPGDEVGRIACRECGGSGWWGYGPTDEECGPCIQCKGTGREWVGLW